MSKRNQQPERDIHHRDKWPAAFEDIAQAHMGQRGEVGEIGVECNPKLTPWGLSLD